MKRIIRGLLLFGLTSALATSGFTASQIVVDENGHGTSATPAATNTLAWTLAPDPTGGLLGWNVLIYTLPFAGVRGDVLVQEPVQGNPIGDVLRFDGLGSLIFYSESATGYRNLADTPGTPNPFLANIAGPYLEVPAGAPEGQPQWLDYTPGVGQPGYDAAALPSYRFYSDIPEPSAGWLVLSGLGVLWLAQSQRRSGSTRPASHKA